MGLLEIHFHDSKFVFRPSMRVGPTSEPSNGREESENGETPTEERGDPLRFPLDERAESRNRGLVVALFVIGLLLLGRKVLQNRERL